MIENTIYCKEFPLGRFLNMLTKSYYGALTKRLEHLEIERHYSVLIMIEKSAKSCSQQSLSDSLKIDKVTMVRIMNFLMKKGFIKKVVNTKDRREFQIELTAKAKKIMPDIHKAINEVNKAATKGMTKTQQTSFYELLDHAYINLNNLPSHKVFVNFKTSR